MDFQHRRPKVVYRVQPFWSERWPAERVIVGVAAYEGMQPVEVDLATWRERWLPGMEKDGLLVGLNWSGERATGTTSHQRT
jgi:Protein of unknown function (DUF2750)